ncbi:MAG TPA: GLPGLI family protein [Saprospiraceae bacterium]|nr:GLPGLI family protein [Saprospiraceae bacterium]
MKRIERGLIQIIIFVIFNWSIIKAQQVEIEYTRIFNWVEVINKMDFLSQEEKDRNKLVYGNRSNEGSPYILIANEDGSVYKEKEREGNVGYTWRSDEDIFITYTEENMVTYIRELLGKRYLIEDQRPQFKWKILNELKEIAGFLCMKAETINHENGYPVFAWFTNKIPIHGGPEGFSGLPGMILSLELNGDDVVIIAKKVQIENEKKPLPLPKKMKGKKIGFYEFSEMKRSFIQKTLAANKYPFWQLRY